MTNFYHLKARNALLCNLSKSHLHVGKYDLGRHLESKLVDFSNEIFTGTVHAAAVTAFQLEELKFSVDGCYSKYFMLSASPAPETSLYIHV